MRVYLEKAHKAFTALVVAVTTAAVIFYSEQAFALNSESADRSEITICG